MTQVPLRGKDVTVLEALLDGADDLFDVGQVTTLNNRERNHIFDKLEEADLIEVTPQSGRVTRVVNGQRKSFEAPKKAVVTEAGVRAVAEYGDQGGSAKTYMDMEQRELVETVRELQNRVDRLESGLSSFRKQVVDKLDERSE